MKVLASLFVAAATGLLACSSDAPTGPESADAGAEAALSAASNSWSPKAPYPGHGLFQGFAATAPNSAGQPVVYRLGGTDGEGGTGFPVHAYNVATNAWTIMTSRAGVFGSNGASKIGSKIYFSGGYNAVETPSSFTNAFWAFDYTRDRMIPKANLPIFGAEGVSGVIGGKLYVLPGACSGDRYPNPGYCAQEPTRRFYRYDPATDTWVNRKASPHFHRSGAAGVINDKLYVVGGFNGFTPVANLDVYDPSTNTWTSLAPIPAAGRAIGTVLGGKLFVITSGSSGLRSYVYTPGTNSWRGKAAPAQPHDGVVRVSLNGSVHLVAVGGSHGLDLEIPNDTELYTP